MARPRPRILFAAYRCGHESDGGMESATSIFEALAQDCDWHFATTGDSRFAERWRAGGAAVHMTAYDQRRNLARRCAGRLRWSVRLATLINRTRPDVIHANDVYALRALHMLPAHMRRPLLYTMRGTEEVRPPINPVWPRMARKLDRVVVLSDEMGDRLVANLPVSPEKVRRIGSMVDTARLFPVSENERASLRAALGIAEHEFAIGCVGAVQERKNQLKLVERLGARLVSHLPRARLHFLGDYEPETDDYAARCRDAAAARVKDRAVFHGHAGSMPDWYRAFDVLVIASRSEGLARCMIEGMASGLPVISFDVCSARETLDETRSGIVVRQGDYDGLLSALETLAADPELRRGFGARARATAAERFAVDRVAKDWRNLYDEVRQVPRDLRCGSTGNEARFF